MQRATPLLFCIASPTDFEAQNPPTRGTIINESQTARIKITIPKDAVYGETIHMICEVSDSGKPALTKYQRIIITVCND